MGKGLEGIKTVRDFEFKDKVVFLRLDLNVPIKKGEITDETRILAALPTIEHIVKAGGKIVMASHLGRPKGGGDEDRKKYTLEPVAKRMSSILDKKGIVPKAEVILVEDPASEAPKALLPGLKKHQLILLENLRFNPGEEKNDEKFAHIMASYCDIYINDAFGSSHRAHASISGIPAIIKNHGMGFLVEKEVRMLSHLLQNPERPYIAIMGGAKVSDKIDVIENMMDRVDAFIIGGAMAYTFLKAQGVAVGKSLVEADKLNFASEMLKRVEARNKTILLPVDHIVAQDLENPSEVRTTQGATIDEGWMGLDIGPKTLEKYSAALQKAKTVFWNGPMGVFEKEQFSKGTFGVAKVLANSSAQTIVGGGDSAAAAQASGYADKMAHISTGGGASLEYLQGEPLPGVEILRHR